MRINNLFLNLFLLIIILAALALVSCGGGGGGGGGELNPPANLSIREGADFDTIEIYWEIPQGTFDGYEIWFSIEGSPYEKAHDGLIEPDVYGLIVELEPATPELVTFSIKIRSTRSGSYSIYSEEAFFDRGVRPPYSLEINPSADEEMVLTWTNTSLVAESIKIERAAYDHILHSWGDFTPIDQIQAGLTHYNDSTSLEVNVWYRYRLTNVADDEGVVVESKPIANEANGNIFLAPPTDLVISADPDGILLTWTNNSRLATGVKVHRYLGYGPTENATFLTTVELPLGSTNHLDEEAIVGGYTYIISAASSIGPAYDALSDEASILYMPPDGPSLFSGEVLLMPDGAYVDKSNTGEWYFGFEPREHSDPAYLYQPDGLSWLPIALPDGILHFAPPGISLESDDTPNSFYSFTDDFTTSNPLYDLVHGVITDGAISTEVIATTTLSSSTTSPGFWFNVSTDNSIHLLWKPWERVFPGYATNASGLWETSTIDSALYDPVLAYTPAITSGNDGTVFVTVNSNNLVLHTKPAGEGWSEEIIPLTYTPYFGDDIVLVASDSNNLHIFYEYDPPPPLDELWLIHKEKIDGVWSDEEVLATRTSYDVGNIKGVISPSGERVALLYETLWEGLRVFLFEPADGWSQTMLSETYDYFTYLKGNHLEFMADETLEILTPAGNAADGYRYYFLFSQDP